MKYGTLLVIDDNPSILTALKICLGNMFERILTLPRPDTAPMLLQQEQVNLILLDMNFSLPCYSQSDLSLNYSAKVTKALGIKEVSFGVDINNIFNRHYAASAFTWSNATGYGYTLDNRFKQIAYIPMADTTWMTHLTLKF